MRLLIVEDDARIRSFLVRGLSEEGFAVDTASDGEDGAFKASDPAYDLIILDVMLPRKDGWEILRSLQGRAARPPVLVLTAKDDVSDRVRGLNDGADDYLVKPFRFDELLARLRALLRRPRSHADWVLRVGALTVDRATRRVGWEGRRVELSAREFLVLEYLAQHPGHVLSRTRLYEHVWNEQMEPMSNTLDVHVKEIRRKLAAAGGARAITTVRGAGYRLEAEAR
jgi:two-component system, OmpR family, response regulator